MAQPFEETQEIADVYAAALFALARDAGQVAEVRRELEELARLGEQDPSWAEFLRSDMIKPERRAASLERLFRGRLSEIVLNAWLVMNRHGRADLLSALLRCFVVREEHEAGQIEVTATSAVELEPTHRTAVEQWAAKLSGRKPLVTYRVDPEILGGLVVQIGDYRFDNSVRRHLHAARLHLMERASRGLAVTAADGSAVS